MARKRKRKQTKQLGQNKKTQIELTVTQARNWLENKQNFSSSVRLLAQEWGWGTNKVSTFLRKLESEGALTRTFGGAGKTQFEMTEMLDEIPASLDPQNKQSTAQIGIDIEQVYMGDIALSPESLDKLNAVYCDVMENDAVTDLSVEQLDMIASILERQTAHQKTDTFQEPAKLEFINVRAVRSLRAFQVALGKIVGSDRHVRAGQ